MAVGIRDCGTDGIICSGGDCAVMVATKGISAGPEAGVDVVGVEMMPVADVADGETPPPRWGPSSFFFSLSSNLSLILKKHFMFVRKPVTSVVLIAVQISLSDEVIIIRHFCGGNRAAEQALLLPDSRRPMVSHSRRRRPHLVTRRDGTVAGFMSEYRVGN